MLFDIGKIFWALERNNDLHDLTNWGEDNERNVNGTYRE